MLFEQLPATVAPNWQGASEQVNSVCSQGAALEPALGLAALANEGCNLLETCILKLQGMEGDCGGILLASPIQVVVITQSTSVLQLFSYFSLFPLHLAFKKIAWELIGLKRLF